MTHGTTSGYAKGCRCDLCKDASSAYAKEYRRLNKKPRKVSAEIARMHIVELNGYGLGSDTIADASGCGPATIRLIRQGRQKRIYQRTEQRILSVTPEALSDGTHVDATVPRHLIRCLRDEGYKAHELARALGRARLGVMDKKHSHVWARTAMRVEKLYRQVLRGEFAR